MTNPAAHATGFAAVEPAVSTHSTERETERISPLSRQNPGRNEAHSHEQLPGKTSGPQQDTATTSAATPADHGHIGRCAGCGTPIIGRYASAKWCNDACRVRTRRALGDLPGASDRFWTGAAAVTRRDRPNKARTRPRLPTRRAA